VRLFLLLTSLLLLSGCAAPAANSYLYVKDAFVICDEKAVGATLNGYTCQDTGGYRWVP